MILKVTPEIKLKIFELRNSRLTFKQIAEKLNLSQNTIYRNYFPEIKENNARRCREYNLKNIKKIKDRKRKYYIQNKEKIIQKSKKNYKDNKVKTIKRIVEYNRTYRPKRYASDICYKLTVILRGRLRGALKHNSKSNGTLKLLGCSVEFFKLYLESLFQPGMNWGNYSYYGWHVDHIIPCCQFDLTIPENQYKCFHYTNLRPLWAEDNLSRPKK